MERIGVRELRQHASRWLRRVLAGESFEITDRGRPVAILAPVRGASSTLDRLVSSGELRAPTSPPEPAARPRPARVLGDVSASVALAELRDEARA